MELDKRVSRAPPHVGARSDPEPDLGSDAGHHLAGIHAPRGVGQLLKVTDQGGRTQKVRVERVTASGLDLVGPRNQRETLSEAEIVRVVRSDSNADGMLLGLLGRVGVGTAMGRVRCRGDSSCSAAQLAVGLPVGAGVGLRVGYLLDARGSRTLFDRARTVSLLVTPVVGARTAGGRWVVRWR